MESIHGGLNGPIDRSRANEATALARKVLADEALRHVLSTSSGGEVPVARQLFVNRNLHFSRVELVGFDMDYTLAIYHQRRLEELSYQMTIERLVVNKGYPESVRSIPYDQAFVMRGLFIDKKSGNLLKIDRFGHVGRAYHGKSPLSDEALQARYRNERIRLKSPDYAWIDTLFALPEACLYAGIVDLLEQELRQPCDYSKLYDDIRDAIDTVHRDNSLKTVVRADLAKYIFKDPELGPALHKLRSGGKKLFLLTNSAFDFTRAVMGSLLDGVMAEYPSWRNYFDYVVTDAKKPEFFSGQHPFIEVDQTKDDNSLLAEATSLERGKIYRGGNLAAFERMTGSAGESVLYVGDHIYGDILKSKKTSMWRTCMIVQEIEDEIAYLESRTDEITTLAEVEALQARLDDEVQRRKVRLNQVERRLEKNDGDAERLEEEFRATKAELDRLRKALKECTAVVKVLEQDLEAGFNSFWGLHFKEGTENSRFGEQVEQYACLYTSRVSNFVFYSPMHVFRSPREVMPHERAGALSVKLGTMGSEGLPKASLRAPTEIP